jgi:hypothetical protein
VVLPDSHGVSRVPHYLGYLSRKDYFFRIQGFHLLWPEFPPDSAKNNLCNFPAGLQTGPTGPATPVIKRLQAITYVGFRLFPFRSPLLGESQLFSVPRGTEMFHFPRFSFHTLFYSGMDTQVLPGWVAPFGNLRINAC